MKLKSFDEVSNELDKLRRRVDLLFSKDIDMKQRRVVNASPSVDPNDYVIRRELVQTPVVKTIIPKGTTSSGKEFNYCVFGIAINTAILVATDVCPRHIVTAPVESGQADQSAVLNKVYGIIKTPPLGTDLIVTVYRHRTVDNVETTTKLFSFTFVDSEDGVQTLDTFDEDGLLDSDNLSINVDQIGTDVEGQNLYLKLVYEWQ